MSFWSKLFGSKKSVNKVEEVKTQPVEEPVVVEVSEPVNEPVVAEVSETVEKPVVQENKDVYQVKVHLQDGWQVIKKGAKRATRRVPTQAAGIEYCKLNNLKCEVLKLDGTLR